MANGRGGARAGAGRKPKALRYAQEIADAEQRLITALPDVVESLIAAALSGDVSAGKYLMDRVWGRVKEEPLRPWAHDQSEPFTEEKWQQQQVKAERWDSLVSGR